uniref:Uncharacterized protein n=1 Tax=Cacopsylla melanoneura TaxID=428564 RepID=A0A8D8V4V4_9HEMI
MQQQLLTQIIDHSVRPGSRFKCVLHANAKVYTLYTLLTLLSVSSSCSYLVHPEKSCLDGRVICMQKDLFCAGYLPSRRVQTSKCAGSCSVPQCVSTSAGNMPHFSRFVLHLATPTRKRFKVLHTG